MPETSQSNNEPALTIFTDGASRGNPGPGGYGAVLVLPDENSKSQAPSAKSQRVVELGGHERETTNNRMELKAAIEALREIRDTRYEIRIYTDSSYVLKGITGWVHSWRTNGWKTKSGDGVKNADLWQELADLAERFAIDWQLLEGHVGVAGNERADEIATAHADGKDIELFSGPLNEYPYNVSDVSHDKHAKETKDSSKKSSSAQGYGGRRAKSGKAYSYVSMVDGEIKTHNSWPECEKRVKGKNAWFRKALSADHEKEIVENFRNAS